VRASRATHKHPREIVAGDVLHDLATGTGHRAVGPDHFDADDQIARCPVLLAPRAAVVGRDDAADGCLVGGRRIERQPLA
jgi:hypothetical protein